VKIRRFVVVDSKMYARTNCFVSQLIHSLNQVPEYQIKIISLEELLYGKVLHHSSDPIIFIMRQRIFNRLLDDIACKLNDRPIYFYDQDPWNSYLLDSPSYSFYSKAKRKLNLEKLYLTSKWWADYVQSREKINATFVRMWMLPKYCSPNPPFEMRKTLLGFRGTLRNHRKDFFNQLNDLGIEPSIELRHLRYRAYLRWLSNVKIYLHNESGFFNCDFGLSLMSNAMWIKDIEIATRGTYVIRDDNSECLTYDVDQIPLIRTYRSISEVPEMIESILGLTEREHRLQQEESIKYIFENNHWSKTAESILSGK